MSSLAESLAYVFDGNVPHTLQLIVELLSKVYKGRITECNSHRSKLVTKIRGEQAEQQGTGLYTVTDGYIYYGESKIEFKICIVAPTFVCIVKGNTVHIYMKDAEVIPRIIVKPDACEVSAGGMSIREATLLAVKNRLMKGRLHA